jgi:ribA/ribD-fused uncharacterized protein
MSEMIAGFQGEYRFLSNFWECHIQWDYKIWPTAEHLYQAFKTTDSNFREQIRVCRTAGIAKRLGKDAPLRPDWEQVKLATMFIVLSEKFKCENCRSRLKATGDAVLMEVNTWGDYYWGCDNRLVGRNHLGNLLMLMRSLIVMEDSL